MINYFKRSVLATLSIGFAFSSYAQTSVKEVPKGWHLKDKAKDGFYGISLDKAYEFVKGKKSQTVIVAVIDSGIDTTHEDLKPVLWINKKEIPGNGVDDDKNGYIDDVHGWNFLGGKDGRNVKEDSYEVARVYHKYKSKFKNIDPTALNKEDQEKYRMWKRAEIEISGGQENTMQLLILRRTYDGAVKSDSILRKAMFKETYSGTDLEAFIPTTDEARKAKSSFLYFFTANKSMEMTNKSFLDEFNQYLSGEEKKAEAAEKVPKDYRGEIVKDNEDDINDRNYGNNDVMASTPDHGTHVAGIIAAVRNNGKGVDGIADNVQIMLVRPLANGDEHDKDVALAIRYAVDNGARIINMSFGKYYSPQKKWVDEAVKYAESKNVLIVRAAGNDGYNLDTIAHYPTSQYLFENKKANNWITVGASGDSKSGGLLPYFSNYGKQEVDIFAPGVRIYSAIPGGATYGFHDGTSMASPVVAGTAAFLLSYFPSLTAQQLKYVIEKSAVKVSEKTIIPATGKSVSLTDLSTTGAVINAYEAAKLAAQVVNKGTAQPNKKTEPGKNKTPSGKSF